MPADVCWKRLKLNGCVPDIEEDKAAVGGIVRVDIQRVFRTYARGRMLEEAQAERLRTGH